MRNAEWKTVTLGSVFDIARGGSPRPIDKFITDDPNGVNWIMISDATSKYITSTKKRIIKEGMKKSREVHPGDFLLTNSMSFGRPYIMQTSGCIHDGWLVMSPRGGVAHPDYFYHLLGSDVLYAEFERRAAGATVKNLNIDLVKGVEVLLPPMVEQRRIAEVLDRAEALRVKRRAALAQLNTLTQSLFLDLFGDPANNPKGWPSIQLGDVVFSASDGPHVSPDYVESGIPFLSTRHVRPGGMSWEDLKFISPEEAQIHWRKCKPERGDILYTKGGTTGIAKVVDWDKPVAIWVHIALLKTDKSKVEPLWLEAMLNAPFCYQQSQRLTRGIANRDLGLTRMVTIKMYLPPISLQREFARRVTAVEALKTAQRASLAELDALFATLQHQAFKGEL
ncbi:MAG: restriction endonuclease subunit S [Verrucomicrobiota bacterium]